MRSFVLIMVCFVISVLFTAGINACKKSSGDRRFVPIAKNFITPPGFPAPAYDFTLNPVTEQGFQLGRKLFWDNRLSKFLDVSCGSCHQQVAAFTTFDHDLGHGTDFQHTRRNVPAIFNMAWHNSFEWDGKNSTLGDQAMACMMAPEKMGEQLNTVADKLNADTVYQRMFMDAFNTPISGDNLKSALTQFVVILVSANSRYDKMKNGSVVFNESEEKGYQIFKSKCASCHAEPLFTDLSFRNVGFPFNEFHVDYGRMEITGNADDSLKFKVPSLRNIALTGYYGHDGRFQAISQMLNHYMNEIQQGPTLDPLLEDSIPMSQVERFYLQEFLETLTDSTLVSDPDYSQP